MKNLKFLTVALAALTICSCSNENDDILDSGKTANVTIQVVGQETKTRAIGDGAGDNETVHNFVAFAFNGENISGSAYSANANAVTLTASTAAKEVYVVVNTGASLEAEGLFAGVKTLTQLKAIQGDLRVKSSTETSQIGTNLWMHGKGDITFAADGKTGEAAVQVAFSSAKIMVTVTDVRSGTNGYTYSENAVSVLQAGAHANFFSENPSTQTTFYTGDNGYTAPAIATLFGALNHKNVDFTNPTSYHFYTFGNNIKDYSNTDKTPTILTLSSLRTATDGRTSTIYYPIHFSSAEDFTNWGPITPGNQYQINIKLTDNGDGVIDPEVPVTNSSIEVTVTTTPWNTITADKEF